MAKPTLLDLVQDILADADGDEVNNISDTIESDQCARVIRDSFRNIVDIHDLSLIKKLVQLTATSSTTPAQMDRPEGLHSIDEIQYDKRLLAGDDPRFQTIDYMDPIDFITLTSRRSLSDTDTEEMTLTSNFKVLIKNDKAPTYYTQLDGFDEFVFDSYDKALETNLQQSKVIVYGVSRPTLALTNGAVIDLPDHLITLVRNDARAFFFDLYKDGVTKEIDKRQRRTEVRAQRQRHISTARGRKTGPDYGRTQGRRDRHRSQAYHH